MNILAILVDGSYRRQIELAFKKELPEVSFHVIEVAEFKKENVKQVKPDMVVVEKRYSDVDNSSLIQEIRSVSKVPVVLMATERDTSHLNPPVSNKYEGIFEASKETRLPVWMKQFCEECELTARKRHK